MRLAAPPLEAVATHGTRIVLADGRELVDGIASWWTAVHGYNHPHIAGAVADQLARMPHVMFGGLTHAPAERLAARLAALLPGDLDHVFLCDSGSVAVEVALKMAAQMWLNRGVSGRTKVLSFRGGYHGDTMGAMSVCDPEEGMHRRFGAYLPDPDLLRPAAGPRRRRGARRHARGPSRNPGGRDRRAAGPGGGRHAHAPARGTRHGGAPRPPPRPAADRRRDLHRVRAHRQPVRLRAGRDRARYPLPVEGAHRRHHGARRDRRPHGGVRGVLVRGSRPPR